MTGDSEEPTVEPMEWTIRLWERAPSKRYVVIAVSIGSALIGLAMFHNIIMAAIAFVCVAATCAEFIFPLQFRLTDKTARVRCAISVTEIEWSAVKRVIEGSDGVKLSPLTRDSRLAPFRGVYLRYASNREAVLDYVKQFGGESARFLEQGTDR
jgi:hypothetical protein